MAIIPENDRDVLKDKFLQDLINPVNIAYYTRQEWPSGASAQESKNCQDTQQLLEELVALSDKMNLTIHDMAVEGDKARRLGIDKIPAIILDSGEGDRVKYFGIPSGYEFATLIEDVVDLSQGTTSLSNTTKDALQHLEVDVYIRVFVTPT
jgi:alkyl hydroperoxide reductase subunit AhpF